MFSHHHVLISIHYDCWRGDNFQKASFLAQSVTRAWGVEQHDCLYIKRQHCSERVPAPPLPPPPPQPPLRNVRTAQEKTHNNQLHWVLRGDRGEPPLAARALRVIQRGVAASPSAHPSLVQGRFSIFSSSANAKLPRYLLSLMSGESSDLQYRVYKCPYCYYNHYCCYYCYRHCLSKMTAEWCFPVNVVYYHSDVIQT